MKKNITWEEIKADAGKTENIIVREWSADTKIIVWKNPDKDWLEEVGVSVDRNEDGTYGFIYWQHDEDHPKSDGDVNALAYNQNISEDEAKEMMWYMANGKAGEYFG